MAVCWLDCLPKILGRQVLYEQHCRTSENRNNIRGFKVFTAYLFRLALLSKSLVSDEIILNR